MSQRKKYTLAFKLQCIEAHLKLGLSDKAIGRRFGVEYSNVRFWRAFYLEYGIEGLKKKVYTSYTPEFKISVLKTIETEYLSLVQACVKFNIGSTSVIISWRRAFKENGLQGLECKTKGRKPNMENPNKRKAPKSTKPLTREEELLQENEYLRTEVAFLKKLRALAQKDKKHKP
jgi:transposase